MRYTEKNLLISLLSVLSNCWGAQIYLVQDHRALFSKLCLCDIIKVLLYTNNLSHQPQNNIQSTCRVNMLYMSLHEIQPDMKRQLLHFISCGAHVAMEILHVRTLLSLALSLSPSLPLFGRCKWCKFLSCSTPMLFWCDGNPFARPITPSHQH